MMMVADQLVSPNQTVFMSRRKISDNTLLADEMLYCFRGEECPPKRFCFNVNLRKAPDTVRTEVGCCIVLLLWWRF